MPYSRKTDKRSLSKQEKAKLKKLRATKSTAWMIDTKNAIN